MKTSGSEAPTNPLQHAPIVVAIKVKIMQNRENSLYKPWEIIMIYDHKVWLDT